MFEKPGIAELRHAAQQLGMNPSDDYLRAVDEIVGPLSRAYAAARRHAGRSAGGEISARALAPPAGRREPLWRLVCEDRDRGQPRRQARRPAYRAQGQCLPCRRADDDRRRYFGRLCAGRRRHHRRAHSRCRRRNRRQGGVRILLRVRRQPHVVDRAGAESAQALATPPAARRRAAPRWSRRATWIWQLAAIRPARSAFRRAFAASSD